MSVGKKCEICMEQPAVVLCSDCYKCYCDECSEFIHKKAKFKGHKVEAIDEGIVVNAMCPFHDDTPLKLFCVDEVRLFCAMCDRKNLHKNHKLVEVTEIQKDNEVFSAQKARVLFEDSMRCTNDLSKKIESVINKIENDVGSMREKVKKTFEEEHKKLEEEEKKVLNELEDTKNKNVAPLEKHLDILNIVCEYSNLLSEVDKKIKGNSSRLMELNIISEMEKQRKKLELLCGEEMYGLHVTWDNEKRNLSCAKELFNGAPVPSNITFQIVLYKEMEIEWECDLSKVREEEKEKISYVVEMMKNDIEEWKEVYSGKEMKCLVKDFEMSTEYTIRVRCVVNGSMGKWSKKSTVKTFFSDCIWKKCPDYVDENRKYSVDENNPRIATKVNSDNDNDNGGDDGDENNNNDDGDGDNDDNNNDDGDGDNDNDDDDDDDDDFDDDDDDDGDGDDDNDDDDDDDDYGDGDNDDNNNDDDYGDGDNDDNNNDDGDGDDDNDDDDDDDDDYSCCTIIGNTSLHSNKVTSWNIKIIKSRWNDGSGISIGVAPFDIDQGEDGNYEKCGWYFYCYLSTLWSGPPHNYEGKEYGPRKEHGKYVRIGDSVGVVIDTTNGDLSFYLNGVNLGIAFEEIPLDKPLVPCVLLEYKGDSIELDLSSEIKENMDTSILIPSNITTKSGTWDSITLTWDDDEGADFYQVETDGNKSWGASTTNMFTLKELLEDTEHNFRVRTVKDNSVSEWSDAMKGKTEKVPEFSDCVWKKCPDYVDEKKKINNNKKGTRLIREKIASTEFFFAVFCLKLFRATKTDP